MYGEFAGVHSPENMFLLGIAIGNDDYHMGELMLRGDNAVDDGIIAQLKRDDVVLVVPEVLTVFALDVSTTLDMAGLQKLALVGGGTYRTHFFSLYNYNNKSIHSGPSAFDCDYCFEHNKAVDANWTRTTKHSHVFSKKVFCGEAFPCDIKYTEAKTIMEKKAGK